MKQVSELAYKRKFRHLLKDAGVWSDVVEQRSGGSFGFPDLLVLAFLGRDDSQWPSLTPVELKAAELVDADEDGNVRHIWPTKISPAQIMWHENYAQAGGDSRLLVCTGPLHAISVWELPSTRRDVLSLWKAGYSRWRCRPWVKDGVLCIKL